LRNKKKFFFKFLSGTVLKSLPLKKILADKTEKTEPIFDTDHKYAKNQKNPEKLV
jgi:hypothetical protein